MSDRELESEAERGENPLKPVLQADPANVLLAHYKLWFAEQTRDPDARKGATWRGESIDYEGLSGVFESQREYFVSAAPYPGLRSFTPHEGPVFFGRRRDADAVRNLLKDHRMVMVLGGSGSGKSSLVRAGVLPYLNTTGGIPGRGGTWYWCEFRPELSPYENLITALATHVVEPLLAEIRKLSAEDSASAEALMIGEELAKIGLDEREIAAEPARRESSKEKVESKTFKTIYNWVRAPFDAAGDKADNLFNALWEFADHRLDVLDRLAGSGIQAGKPNLLMLVDQFEEVFREAAGAEQKNEVEKLLRLLCQFDEKMQEDPYRDGGLFITLTMRSEEFHRCGERKRLTRAVNRSSFVIELLDPTDEEDKKVLRRAIVEPARRVFVSYGLYDRQSLEMLAGTRRVPGILPDAPFETGVVEWLIEGLEKVNPEHRADRLPLLQHALRALWDEAVKRWSRMSPAEREKQHPLIIGKHLPGDYPDTTWPDLDHCLDEQANCAAAEARGRFAEPLAAGPPEAITNDKDPRFEPGEIALRGALVALARTDNRGNLARRFATMGDMLQFLDNHEETRSLRDKEDRLRRALSQLVFHGYLSGGDGRPYDISHEALLRNWQRCSDWLKPVKGIVEALKSLLDQDIRKDNGKQRFDTLTGRRERAERFPVEALVQLSRIGKPAEPAGGQAAGTGTAQAADDVLARVPDEWAQAHVDMLLRASGERRLGWLGEDRPPTEDDAEKVLEQVKRITREAITALREEEVKWALI